MHDLIVVGAGPCGSIIARHFAENHNKKVLLIDRRNHIAGNLYDSHNDDGILIQQYGPHIFHTNSQKVKKYIHRFAKWTPFKLKCMVYMEGKFTPSPFNYQTVDDYFPPQKAAAIKARLAAVYSGRAFATIVELLEDKDPLIHEYAQFLYDYDYSLYTAKQWGISPSEIDISVLQRVPVLLSYETGYFQDQYQLMPKNGFTAFVQNILDHENITVKLNTVASDLFVLNPDTNKLHCGGKEIDKPVVYTGPLDELLQYRYGPLPYRSLTFDFVTKNMDSFQPSPVVAYPQVDGYTRITEFKKLQVQQRQGVTIIAYEYPSQYKPEDGAEPYYPIQTKPNSELYELYLKDVQKSRNLFLCGRLADYRYYNMDQAIERALNLCPELDKKIL